MKRFCIADPHGNYKALKQVLEKSKFDYKKDMLIVLGDVCDGYKDTYKVVEELLKIKNLVFICGNHDEFLKKFIDGEWSEPCLEREWWLQQGGYNTLRSYGAKVIKEGKGFFLGENNIGEIDMSKFNIPEAHSRFFDSGVYYYELDNMIFVHGGFSYPEHPRNDTKEKLTWDRELIERCKNGLRIKEWDKVFVGHTTTENQGAQPIIYQQEGFGKFVQLDCGAGWKGRLCIYNIDTEEYFLSDYAMELNDGKLKAEIKKNE